MPSENEAMQQGNQEEYGGVTFDYLDDEGKEEEKGVNEEGKEEEEGVNEEGKEEEEEYGGVTFDYLDDEGKEEEKGMNEEGKEEEEGVNEEGKEEEEGVNEEGKEEEEEGNEEGKEEEQGWNEDVVVEGGEIGGDEDEVEVMWACSACTYHNHPDLQICEICEGNRNAQNQTPVVADTAGTAVEALDETFAAGSGLDAIDVEGDLNEEEILAPRYLPYSRRRKGKDASKIGRVIARSDMCTICQFPLLNGEDDTKLLSCGHSFHKKCIDQWIERSNDCPVCREVPEENGPKESKRRKKR